MVFGVKSKDVLLSGNQLVFLDETVLKSAKLLRLDFMSSSAQRFANEKITKIEGTVFEATSRSLFFEEV